jgi:hypothetical protein
MQLRVFRFCNNQDGNIRVGVFPKREEILIGRLGFGGVVVSFLQPLNTKLAMRLHVFQLILI